MTGLSRREDGTAYQVNPQSYNVVVGNFGAGKTDNNGYGGSGGNSRFDTITAFGGVGGASRNSGSDGGTQGATKIGSDDPVQGNAGGSGSDGAGGGGGGAGAPGAPRVSGAAGAGGAGKTSAISGFETGYAGGGGGGRHGTTGSAGSATHGGGTGGFGLTVLAQDGMPNTGGGGGGGGDIGNDPVYRVGGDGGSGVVVVRYAGGLAGTGGTVAVDPGSAVGYTVHSFTAVGTTAFDLSGVDLNARLGATVTGDLSGSGSLVYNGPGTLTLAGANTYTGDTTVNAGTLVLGSTGELRFALNDGGLSNQIVGPGGTITLDGLLRLDNSLVTDLEGTWNLIDLDSFGLGDATFGGSFNLALAGGPAFANLGDGLYSYLSGKSLWEFSESTGGLTLTQIPEPTSLALFGLATLALLKRRAREA